MDAQAIANDYLARRDRNRRASSPDRPGRRVRTMDARTIPEWPGFDPERHGYIAATGGGDGWDVKGESLDAALREDLRSFIEDDDPGFDEQREAAEAGWDNWIDDLYVVEYDNDGNYLRDVARFDPRAFEWREEVR